MWRGGVKAIVSTGLVVAILAAGSVRLRHAEDLGAGPAVCKALNRSGGPSWLADSTDYAPLPAAVTMAPPSHPSGIVHLPESALRTRVADLRHPIRPPPAA